MWHENAEGKYYDRTISQEGEVEVAVSYNYEKTEIVCHSCGIEVDDGSRTEHKLRSLTG